MFTEVRRLLPGGLMISLVACSDMVNERYATWNDAQRDGAVERGWVPAFVPKTARQISDVHNLDTNAQTLTFAISPSDVPAMAVGLHPVRGNDVKRAEDLARDFGLPALPRLKAYVVCSKILSGALLVDQKNGRAVYKTPVNWVEDDCTVMPA